MEERRQTMSKYEMVRLLRRKGGFSKLQADFIYELLFDEIVEWIKEGKEVALPKLGRFVFAKSEGTRKSNLKVGAVIGPHDRVKFRMNQDLARHVRVSTRVKKQ